MDYVTKWCGHAHASRPIVGAGGWALAAFLAFGAGWGPAYAQAPSASQVLDSLVARALAANPQLAAASARVAAANARIGPAGARPDPMLMAGVQNFPIADPGFADFMTMRMVGVEQTVPYRGKLAARTNAARAYARAEELRAEAERRRIIREVHEAFSDLVEARLLLSNMEHQQRLLSGLLPAADGQYASGTSDLRGALLVRQEAAAIAADAATVSEDARAALARLNAALDQRSNAQLLETGFPAGVLRMAGADSTSQAPIVPMALGERVPGSGLLTDETLQLRAVEHNAALRAHAATIDAQAAELTWARRAHLPDVTVGLSYAHRSGFTDMVTATVSVPLAIQRSRVQDAQVAEAQAELVAREAEHNAGANAVRAGVARLVAEIERERTQIALLRGAMLPLNRAAAEAAVAGFSAGRAELAVVLAAYRTQFRSEYQVIRAVGNVARALAALEELVGTEVTQ